MDPFDSTRMMNQNSKIRDLFADYRAEWLQTQFASLFIPPPYLAKLEGKRPSFLIGGRGTGKTTTLRSMRFDSNYDRLRLAEDFPRMRYYGIYVRVNKNRVRAFQVPELTEEDRRRAFAHYFNLLVCQEFCQLLEWLLMDGGQVVLNPVVSALGLTNASNNIVELKDYIAAEISRIELFVNNGGRTASPTFSLGDAPIRAFCNVLSRAGYLQEKLLFCCVDEYENLSAEQQSVLNTYIKHAEPPLSYKIGMRRGGLHTRATLDLDDQISVPDDFSEIDIADEGFDAFAEALADNRLQRAAADGLFVPSSITEFLPQLRFDEEARLLGCERIAGQVRKKLAASSEEILHWLRVTPSSQVAFVEYWGKKTGIEIGKLVEDWLSNPSIWSDRLNNHGYASLFWLSQGRKGARLRKYYCGLDTLLSLASGNIRYFLELIDEAIQLQLSTSWDGKSTLYLEPKIQTEAAKLVGKRRLAQLEGLSARGTEIKRLVLAIGKVFFEFARDPVDRAPEQNSFIISGDEDAKQKISKILAEGVAHLAFEETARTKATSPLEMKDEEYRIHPIFCAFFEFSHRRKRRVTFEAITLLKLAAKPSQALSEMMSDRAVTPSAELPEQLAMFTDFFDGETR